MIDTNQVITIVSILLGSGLIQFLLTRKDKKEEDAKKDQFETLRKEFQEGLDDREKTNKSRHDENKLTIEKMSVEHQKDFLELKKAIQQLTDNDTKITDSIQQIADKQGIMADSLIGLCHDRIIYAADKIAEREAITLKEKATLTSIYEPYSRLGGNGECKVAFNHAMSQPVVSDEEAKELDRKLRQKD